MDIKRLIREQLRQALARNGRSTGGTNIAISTNVSRSGSTSEVYSDDDVTIIRRDGVEQVIHHRRTDGSTAEPPDDDRE
jgi:hypothetical protein